MKWLYRLVPLLFLGLFGAEIIVVMLPKRPKDGEFHFAEFGQLPALLNGRVQPLDSVGRNALLQIRSTGDLPLEVLPSWQFWRHPNKLKSTEWLLEVMTKSEVADTRPIFLIHHAELLGELRLQDKGLEKSGLRYYAFDDLKPVLREISEQGQKANSVKAEERTTFQKQVLKLANAVMLYQRLKLSLQPEDVHDFSAELAEYQKGLPSARQAVNSASDPQGPEREALRPLAGPVRQFQLMDQYAYPLIVPPEDPPKDSPSWQNAGASLLNSLRTGEIHPAMIHFAAMATAYHQGAASDFNRALAEYRSWLAPKFAKELSKGGAEYYYNRVKAFLHATIIYVCCFVLACGAVVTLTIAPVFSESLRRSAFWLMILAVLVHSFGLVFRMVLEGRPPVTNLYSSAVFIGWGVAILGIILERMYRVALGSIIGSFAGFVTLLIAHNLALGGDTMEMLRAVLDTNFWLATHVVVITLGYSATFAAGLLAILYIFLGLFTPVLAREISPTGAAVAPSVAGSGMNIGKAMSRMVYGIVCFATLFSFLGTVLGGIWADQSWGRFWGWDPKENGALLIVLWNAIILHARWGGLVRERGIMNLAVFGNIVTCFSWFGVNMLGVGLHSYGFMDSGFKWLTVFIGSQLAIITLGSLPLAMWRSFRSKTEIVGGQTPSRRSRSPAPATT